MKKLSRNSLEDFLLIGLLLFAPLALASVHIWAYCVIAIVALIIFNLYFRNNIDSLKQTFGLSVSIGLFIFIGVVCLYIVTLPAQVVKILSPDAYRLREGYTFARPSWQTLSIYSHSTVLYLIKLITYAMVFFVIVSKIAFTKNGVISANGLCHNVRARFIAPDVMGSINRTPTERVSHAIPSERSNLSSRASEASRGIYKNNDISILPRVRSTFILFGSLTAVFSLLFHSFSDFNLHIPANALYFTVFLALVTGLSVKQDRGMFNYNFLNKLVTSMITISFIVAVFGIIFKLGGNGKIYWLIEKAGAHFGPYINYDHAAGYLEMCACLAVSCFMANIMTSSFPHIKKIKDKIIWFSSEEANKALIYLFVSVVVTVSLFLTTSRGGILSFAVALLSFFAFYTISARKKRRNRILISVFLVILLICIMAIWIGPEETIDRFHALNRMIKFFINERAILSELRPFIWTDTINLIKMYPFAGAGLGTYGYVFPAYRTFSISYGFLRYAHNDYLHFISEMGMVGGVFLLGFFIWYYRKFRDCLRRLKRY